MEPHISRILEGGIMQTCAKCHQDKPETTFGVDNSRKSGRNPYCKDCIKIFARNYTSKGKTEPDASALRMCTQCLQEQPLVEFYKDKSRSDGYSKRCKKCTCAKVQEYCENNPEKRKQDKLAWKKTPAGKISEKRYYDNNRDAINERVRDRYAADPDRIKNKIHAWRIKNPEKAKAIVERGIAMRNARMANLSINDLTNEEWRDILALFDYRCAYCHTPSDRLERDHIIPVSKDGPNTKTNIAPSCRRCNMRKHDNILGFSQDDLLQRLVNHHPVFVWPNREQI